MTDKELKLFNVSQKINEMHSELMCLLSEELKRQANPCPTCKGTGVADEANRCSARKQYEQTAQDFENQAYTLTTGLMTTVHCRRPAGHDGDHDFPPSPYISPTN
jgi:hypothetical protein